MQVTKQNVEESLIIVKKPPHACIEKEDWKPMYMRFIFMGSCMVLIFLKDWV